MSIRREAQTGDWHWEFDPMTYGKVRLIYTNGEVNQAGY